MGYKACVFDFDLTLADSSDGIILCFKHTLKKFGYVVPSDKTIYDTIGLTLVDAFDLLTGIKNNPQRDEMRVEYVKEADIEMVSNTHFYNDTLDVLRKIQNYDIKIGIVSTKLTYRIVDSFKVQLGCMPVDIIVGGGDVTLPKPNPQGLNSIIGKFGLDKREVLYIGDSYIDAQTAENAGVDFCGTTTGSTDYDSFCKYKNVYIGNSLSDIFDHIDIK